MKVFLRPADALSFVLATALFTSQNHTLIGPQRGSSRSIMLAAVSKYIGVGGALSCLQL
jgi:hypothetical protein